MQQNQLTLTLEEVMQIFSSGIDFGLLKAEEERDQEELCEAYSGHFFSQKFAMPMASSQKRQARSYKWRQSKKESYEKYFEILKNKIK